MKTRAALPLLIAIGIAIVSCSRQAPVASVVAPAYKPVSSIQDLMVAIVDPSADALWESVSSETTIKGTEEKQPRSAEEWAQVRRHAVALQEAGNLLIMPGRPVTHGGKDTEDAGVAGVSSAQQVGQAIAAARPGFDASARALQDAAGEALQAIDAKDLVRLLAAGARLDQACERCHSTYWYPNAKEPLAQWPAPLKAK